MKFSEKWAALVALALGVVLVIGLGIAGVSFTAVPAPDFPNAFYPPSP